MEIMAFNYSDIYQYNCRSGSFKLQSYNDILPIMIVVVIVW